MRHLELGKDPHETQGPVVFSNYLLDMGEGKLQSVKTQQVQFPTFAKNLTDANDVIKHFSSTLNFGSMTKSGFRKKPFLQLETDVFRD